jgi:hypothetical protein
MLHYFSNGHMLDHVAFQTRANKKRAGTDEPGDEPGIKKKGKPPWRNIRAILLEAFGEQDFNLAIDTLILGKTCAQYGETLRQSAGTACRKLQKLKARMRQNLLLRLRRPTVGEAPEALSWLKSFCQEMLVQELVEIMIQDRSCLIPLATLSASSESPAALPAKLLGEERFSCLPTLMELRKYIQLHEFEVFCPQLTWLAAWKGAREGQWVCGFPYAGLGEVHMQPSHSKSSPQTDHLLVVA